MCWTLSLAAQVSDVYWAHGFETDGPSELIFDIFNVCVTVVYITSPHAHPVQGLSFGLISCTGAESVAWS